MDKCPVKYEGSFLEPTWSLRFRYIFTAVVSPSNNWQLDLTSDPFSQGPM